MIERHLIDFRVDPCKKDDTFKDGSSMNVDFNTRNKKALTFFPWGNIYLTFDASEVKDYILALGIYTGHAGGYPKNPQPSDLYFSVDVNGTNIYSSDAILDDSEPRTLIVTISKESLTVGTNKIHLKAEYEDGPELYLEYAYLEEMCADDLVEVSPDDVGEDFEGFENSLSEDAAIVGARPRDNKVWMSRISNSVLLTALSIPGTHDSAAYNRIFHTFWSCQDRTIRSQLEGGIRILDIRIGINGDTPDKLVTCHGSISWGEYESLRSVFTQVVKFIGIYSSECVIMTLKVEDWGSYDRRRDAGKLIIKDFLSEYTYCLIRSSSCPTMGEARGKIYLINRIDDSLDFGTPIDIPNNTKGSHLAPTRNHAFDVYVQDYYQLSLKPITACAAKYKVVKEAIDLRNSNYNHEKDSQMHLCFCSAFRDVFGVYIMEDIINYIADLKKKKNLRVIPWMMFDYPFISYTAIFRYYNVNVVNAVIEVNYSSYGGGLLQDDFTVKSATGEEL